MQNRNLSISQDMNRIFDLKGESTDFVSEIIQPVVFIESSVNVIRNQSSAISGTMTVYTTPTDKDFYLSSANISLMKDVVCDMATGNVLMNVVPFTDGVARDLLRSPIITLTAQTINREINFDPSIKLPRNCVLSVSGTFTAGVCVRCGGITGYTVETTK